MLLKILIPPDSNALANSFGLTEFVFDVSTSEMSDIVKFSKLLDTWLSVHDVIDDIVL